MTNLLKLTEYFTAQDAIKADIARVNNILVANGMKQVGTKYTGFKRDIYVGENLGASAIESFSIIDEMMTYAVQDYGSDYNYYAIPVSYLDLTDEQVVAELKRIASAKEAATADAKKQADAAKDKADYELYLKLKDKFDKA